jgi:hypothetical protein
MPLLSLKWLADRSLHPIKWVLNARIRTFLLAGALLSWLFCLPHPLFDQPISTVLLDREGGLLAAKIASDEQWRFPMADSLPSKYVQAVLFFEDQHFYYHPGVNPVSLFRAAYTNLQAGRIVNGGSTLSMQVIRLARNHPPRTFWQKIIDEFYSKYKGLHKWHIKLMQEATTTGKVKLPTGRVYEYKPEQKRGENVFPRTTILNYPVQGLGADLMTIARVSLYNRMRKLNYEKARLVNTVHDSIIIDCDSVHVGVLAKTMLDVFEDVPKNFQKMFGTEFNLPMKAEVQVGNNWKDMEVWNG